MVNKILHSFLLKKLAAFLKSQNSGFTLIELLTAIGIFTILAGVVLVTIDPLEQFRKAQDAKRKSDLAQVQRALEAYYQDFDRYPTHTQSGLSTYTINTGDGSADTAIEWGSEWKPYIDILPVEPNSSKYYIYWSDDTNNNQSYRLYTSLDRGDRDMDACNNGTVCTGVPAGIECGINGEVCNYGVTSPNISP